MNYEFNIRRDILVYGAGNNLIFSFCDLIKFYSIAAITDGNPAITGKKIFGYTVTGINDALKKSYMYIVVTPSDAVGVIKELKEHGVERNRIITLQNALDMVPDNMWEASRLIPVRNRSDFKIAIIIYGGIGDLLIGKRWLISIIKKYNIITEQLHIHIIKKLYREGIFIYNDIIPEENICSIDTDNDDFFNGGYYNAVLRFCVMPEVWYKGDISGLKNVGLRSYVDDLYEYGRNNYNRGLFTASGFCDIMKRLVVENKENEYYSSYDVFNNLDHNEDEWKLNLSDERESYYLAENNLAEKKYITINTGQNDEYLKKNNTRAWPFAKWREFALFLKKEYPHLTIVQVGTRMSETDDVPADLHLNGKTTLEQIAILLKHALLHIDYEGGLVHVRHVVGGKSIVVLGPSSEQSYGYPENIYVHADACSPCEWQCPQWLSVCMKGYETPVCMDSITPNMVMEKIRIILKEL